jgi:asparagine synthase (glutamine-hydrolysing)
MSGICGVLALDGRDHSPEQIENMLRPLEQRGPDGSHSCIEGPVALGHALLATTPEALSEVLPLTDPDSGCTITADVRLDNREQLIPALGVAGENRVIGDGELILRSYLRWGEECVEQLLGDFAFAIWDPRSEQFFCARDHMGLRQLTYSFAAGKLFAFATEPAGILASGLVPATVNEGRIADYLDNLEGLGFTSTFYREIFRLPPAHCLTVGRDGLSLRRYWMVKPQPELELPNDDAYTKAFLEVFTEAVRCRLRSPSPVGSMLSGGMDSGSVAAVAAKLLAAEGRGPLKTFSATGPDPESCIETRTIKVAAASPGFDPAFVDHSSLEDLKDDLIRLTEDESEPFDGSMVLIRSVYLTAHRAGIKVMLDGVAGDLAFNPSNHVAEMLRQGRFGQAVRKALEQQRFYGASLPAWKALMQSAWVAFVPSPLRRLRRNWTRLSAHRAHCAGIDFDPAFAARTRLRERRKGFHRQTAITSDSHRELRARALRHPHLVVGRERYDRVASQLAIEPRDPFMDLRVIRFALSLPLEQLEAGGWPKLILRRAMEGLLPHQVVWRRGKEHLGMKFNEALFEHWPGWREALGDGITGLAYVSASGRSGKRNQNTRKALDFQARITLFSLFCWLRRNRCSGFRRVGD